MVLPLEKQYRFNSACFTEHNYIGKMATKCQFVSLVLLVTLILGSDFVVGYRESKKSI